MKINGDLLFSLGAELQNAIIERRATDPVTTEVGRIYYNTVENEYRFYNPSGSPVVVGWTQIGAEDLAEILRTSMGNVVNADGTFNTTGTGLNSLSNISGATDLFEALSDLNNAIVAGTGGFTLTDGTTTRTVGSGEIVDVQGTSAGGIAGADAGSPESGTLRFFGVEDNDGDTYVRAATGPAADGDNVQAVSALGSTLTLNATVDIDSAAGSTSAGGAVNIDSGAGDGNNNAGGTISITSGNDTLGTSYGGSVDVYGGVYDGVSGFGGDITIAGGAGGNAYYGGSVTVNGGAGTGDGGNIDLNAGAGTYYGGNVTIDSGAATNDNAGDITLRGGISAAGGAYRSGNVGIYGGATGAGGADAGAVTVKGGSGTTATTGGLVTIEGGGLTGASANTGGTVQIHGGRAFAYAGTTGGSIELQPGDGATPGTIDIQPPETAGQGSTVVRFFEEAVFTNFIGLRAPATLAGDVTYTLPIVSAFEGGVLTTTIAGVMSWADPSSFGASRLEDLDDVTASTGSPPTEDVDNSFLIYNTATDKYEANSPADSRTALGLVAGGAGDIWVEKAGDTMSGDLTMGSTSQIFLNDGAIGDPAIAFTSDPDSGFYYDAASIKITYGGIDRVLVDATDVSLALPLDMGSNKITSLADGTAAADAVNFSQLQASQAGILVKAPSRVATTTSLDNIGNGTWSAAGSGVGKTLTAGAAGTTTIDGVLLANGDRVLVKDEPAGSPANLTAADHGIYVVSAADAGSATILTRADDFDGAPGAEITAGAFTFVQEGTANDFTGWVLLNTGFAGSPTPNEGVIDSDSLNFVQFQGLPEFVGGDGIDITGDTISVDQGAGLEFDGSSRLRIDFYDNTNGALILTTDGTSREDSNPVAMLHLLLDPAGGLTQTSAGLAIDGGTGFNLTDGTTTRSIDHGDELSVTGGIVSADSGSPTFTGTLKFFRIEDADGDTYVRADTSATADGDAVNIVSALGATATFNATVDIDSAAGTGGSAGGIISLTSGAGDGSGAGGEVDLTAGAGGATGVGGAIDINAGAGGATSGTGGVVTINGGNGSTQGGGGGVTVSGGNGAGTNAFGGDVTLNGGTGSTAGNGEGGDIILNGGTGDGTGKGGDIELTPGDVDAGSVGTVNINPPGDAAGETGEVRWLELAANGTNYIGMKAPDAITTNVTYTLPEAPAANDYLLQSQTDGTLAWIDPATVGTTRLENLADVVAATSGSPLDAAGNVLVADGVNSYDSKAIQFNYDSTLNGGASTSHTVTHNLGQRFVNVTVYEQSGSPTTIYSQVIPESVTLDSTTALTVTFNTAIDCVIVVTGVPGVPLA